MHKGASLALYNTLSAQVPGLQHGRGFSAFMRSFWRGLPFDKRLACVRAAEDFGGVRVIKEPLGFIPDGYTAEIAAGEDENTVITIWEVEVTSFISLRKAYKIMRLSEILWEGADVRLLIGTVDRYGEAAVRDPEAIWMWHVDRIAA